MSLVSRLASREPAVRWSRPAAVGSPRGGTFWGRRLLQFRRCPLGFRAVFIPSPWRLSPRWAAADALRSPISAASVAVLLMLPSALIADTSDHLNVRPRRLPTTRNQLPGRLSFSRTVPSAPHEVARPVARRLVLRRRPSAAIRSLFPAIWRRWPRHFWGGNSGCRSETLRQALTRHYVEQGYVNSGALLGEVRDGILARRYRRGATSAISPHGARNDSTKTMSLRRLVRDENAVLNVGLRERFLLLPQSPLFERINARLVSRPEPGKRCSIPWRRGRSPTG